jgi:hypothetical protein
MPMTSMTLRPGVNTMMTLSQNEAGVSASQLVRYQQGMIQKYGGWSAYYPVAIGSTIKEIWGWQDNNSNKYLGIGATQSLSVIISGANTDISPQTRTSSQATFSVSSGNTAVTVVDPNSSVSALTAVFITTPVNVGGVVLNGEYTVTAAGGSSSYIITSSIPATTTVSSSGIYPTLTTIANSGDVTVTLPSHGQTTSNVIEILNATTVGGNVISGQYNVQSVLGTSAFTIRAAVQSSAAATATIPESVVYFYQVGPPAYLGYGLGGYGLGGYGLGVAAPTGSGSLIGQPDWTMANWGEILLACGFNGLIFFWSPQGGTQNVGVVSNAPIINGGIFISQPQQILVSWASTPDQTGFGWVQDPLLIRWSDSLNFNSWTPTSQNSAGSFHLPSGSIIKGGIQSAQQGIIWTDVDCWVMQYVGQPLVFGFSRVGSGCGLVGMHAQGVLNGAVYWMGPSNFFVLGGEGVTPVPCPVWNFVFQNIDTSNLSKVRCAVNSLFNEVSWFFPHKGTGNPENTLYVKYNTVEKEWDYGSLGRSAWIDATVLGNPIGADLNGLVYQHEVGYNAGTVAIDASFQSGYWTIAEGEEMAVVDWILPDMTFLSAGGDTPAAMLSITFYATDYTGDSPRTYGPYPYSSTTEYINTRIRGRFMSMKIEGMDINTFWRIGRLRYRYAIDGRR